MKILMFFLDTNLTVFNIGIPCKLGIRFFYRLASPCVTTRRKSTELHRKVFGVRFWLEEAKEKQAPRRGEAEIAGWSRKFGRPKNYCIIYIEFEMENVENNEI